MKRNDILNIIGTIVTLIGIGISIEGMRQQPEPIEYPVCTVGNIVAGDDVTININCTVAP